MKVFTRLIELYEARGFQVRTSATPFAKKELSLNPDKDLSFTYILRDGKLASPYGGGLHLTEVCFLELLGSALRRERVLVIGNSFGWSTLALALANPEARIVAIDACGDPLTEQGLILTNNIAQREGLNVKAVKGWSPDDVPRIAADLRLSPDLILIDAWHDDQHQTADFGAARRIASPDCVYLFHDVIGCEMERSFLSFIGDDFEGAVLTRTQSGMGILYPASLAERVQAPIKAFTEEAVAPLQMANGTVRYQYQLPSRERGEIVGPSDYSVFEA